MKFSIIVPIFNAEKALSQCIESILLQKFKDFELLLIDDGSTDNSGGICDAFAKKDSRIKVFHLKNSGVGAARNYGILESKGEWICFVDSDDEVTDKYLEAFLTEDVKTDLVISGIDVVNVSNGKLIRKEKYTCKTIDINKNSEDIIPFLYLGYPFAKAYKTSILKNNRIYFPINFSFHEDHVFVFNYILHCNQIEITEKVTYIYKINYSQQSLSKKKHDWKSLFQSSVCLFDGLEQIRYKLSLPEEKLKGLSTFCYEPVISAVYSIYDDKKLGRFQRRNILRKLLFQNLPLIKLYFPTDKKGKLIRIVSSLLPINLLDKFFKVVNIYQNRKK